MAKAKTPNSTPPCDALTRSHIMRRAWQLAHLNNPTCNARARQSLGRWISHAWQEAREGRTDNWTFLSPEHEAWSIEHQLVTLQYDDRRTEAHYALMQSLRDSLSALRAFAVTQNHWRLISLWAVT